MYFKKQTLSVVLRTVAISAVLAVLTFTVLAVSGLISGELIPKTYPEGVPAAASELRAMTVRTQDNADFPSAPNLPSKELKSELEEMVSFASEYGYNAIFFEASPEGDALYRSSVLPSSAFWTGEQGKFTFFDPLLYLTDIAKEKQIQVYAVIDPFGAAKTGLASGAPAAKNPDWVLANGYLNPAEEGVQKLIGKITGELTSQYDIAGIVLSGVDSDAFGDVENYADCIAEIADSAHGAIKHKDSQRLGMVVSAGSAVKDGARDLSAAPLKSGALDFAVVSSDAVESGSLADTLAAWNKRCETSKDGAVYYPLLSINDENALYHAIDSMLYFGRQSGASGYAVSNYGSLHTDLRTAAYSIAASFAQQVSPAMPELTFSQSFAVTRPTETLTVDSSWETYFITGTSDPAQPVLLDGKDIERPSTTGLWGIQVDLPYGTNTYSFSQGGTPQTVTIVRNKPAEELLLTAITKTSAYPANSEAVLDGEQLKLSCTAPAGGTVTASIGGLTAELKQVAATSKNGVAAVYQAQLDVSSLAPAQQVKNIGAVTYQLNYNGLNSTQQSAGEVYASGAGAKPVAQMNAFMVPISKNGKDDGEYSTLLKKDCVDYITENGGGSYYKLASGGYVLKKDVTIPEGAVSAKNTVSALSISAADKGEKIVLSGTARPVFTGTFADGKLVLRLENIAGFDKMNVSKLESTLCASIASEIGEDESVTLTFTLAEDVSLNGWDVQFEGNDTIIYLRRMPEFHRDTAKPLTGITVLLDPGHGGTDPGAAGVPYDKGPWEKTLNLANSYSLQSRLAALGATVYLTGEDENVTLNDRLELAQKYDADIFISSHHNSLALTSDSNTAAGIEIYYYNGQSQAFAENIGLSLADDSGRKLRFAQWSWYRVTMMTSSPAVLVESGFISNPAEYELICDEYAMFQYGNAVADAVLNYFGKA